MCHTCTGTEDPVVDDCISGGAAFAGCMFVLFRARVYKYLVHFRGAPYLAFLRHLVSVLFDDPMVSNTGHESNIARICACHELRLSRNIPGLKHEACVCDSFLSPDRYRGTPHASLIAEPSLGTLSPVPETCIMKCLSTP